MWKNTGVVKGHLTAANANFHGNKSERPKAEMVTPTCQPVIRLSQKPEILVQLSPGSGTIQSNMSKNLCTSVYSQSLWLDTDASCHTSGNSTTHDVSFGQECSIMTRRPTDVVPFLNFTSADTQPVTLQKRRIVAIVMFEGSKTKDGCITQTQCVT